MSISATRQTPGTLEGGVRFANVTDTDRRRAFGKAQRHSMMVRVLKVVLPVCAVLTLAGLFVSPRFTVKAPSEFGGKDIAVEITGDQLRMINPHFEGFTAENGHYEVGARAATQSVGNLDLLKLETVEGKLTEADESWTQIKATGGAYETKKKTMRLDQGIVITTSAGGRVEVASADIDIERKLVTSGDVVTMTMPNGKLIGRGLLIEGEAKRFTLNDDVRARIIPPRDSAKKPAAAAAAGPLSAAPAMSDGPIDVKAKRLQVIDAAKIANFTGGVEARQAGMTLTADQLAIAYIGDAGAKPAASAASSGAQNIRSATALRNVVIVTPDGRRAKADKSKYDAVAESMTLTGAVELSQGGNVLHADMVVADLKTRQTAITSENRVTGKFVPPPKDGSAAGSGLTGLGASDSVTDISARRLDMADGTGEAVFQGTVIVAQRGNRLTGERLSINTEARRMVMSGPGRVSGRFEQLGTGKGGAARQDEGAKVASSGSLGRSFTGLSSKSSAPTNIEADQLVVEDAKGEATFTGKVAVLRDNNRITAGALSVFYATGGASQLVRITARDKVVIKAPDNQVASGDRLLYEAAKNQLVMWGNVTVSQGGNIVHGEKLIVDTETGESHFDTRMAAGSDLEPSAAPKPGRIQVLITPQGIKQIGGPGAKNAPKPKPKAGDAMSASDVMVGPDNQ